MSEVESRFLTALGAFLVGLVILLFLNGSAILDLWQASALIQLRAQPDHTVWRWTRDGKYTATFACRMLHEGAAPFHGKKPTWKTWAPIKVKVFLWLSF